MHRIFAAAFVLLLALAPHARATADRQAFLGAGLGFEVLSQAGSGTGFFVQGQGGYNFSSLFGVGLNIGYSNIGSVAVDALDFGGFLQLTDEQSGLYGKFFLNGVAASTDGGQLRHGVSGSEVGFAPGVALGMLIPSVGDLHFAPEVAYKCAFLTKPVNLVQVTFGLVYDY